MACHLFDPEAEPQGQTRREGAGRKPANRMVEVGGIETPSESHKAKVTK